jgi:hypothetical protein
VLTSCDAFENYPPKAVAYLKPISRFPPALWLLTQTMRLRFVQRLPIAYGWATHVPIEPAIMESFLGDLRSNAGVRRDFAALLRGAGRTGRGHARASRRCRARTRCPCLGACWWWARWWWGRRCGSG